MSFKKYVPFQPIKLQNRQWPSKVLTKAPIWCSVDLRDGNQALVTPMNLEEKIEMFHMLVDMGFKEIEVGFPSASETEYEILRELIDGNHIPDDVTIQVLVQARTHLIEKTFEAVRGAKSVIVHFYNSTSTLQRKVVFQKDMDGIIEIAIEGAKLIRELTEQYKDCGTKFRYEYSPESFTGTEMNFAVEICHKVMETLGVTKDNPIILNLPSTVEMSTPNIYADQIEYFCKKLPNRESAIISLHPHNDRGTGVAATELALLAGGDRVEGTLFGNGERTGNVDIVTLGLNMYTQGLDPELDFKKINRLRDVYERVTKMKVHERHPYAGELVFTAFSGSHQDAIKKGYDYMQSSLSEYWEIPYLPIDPADLNREYEPIIRINSQSGKGGAAFVLQSMFGYNLPKAMHIEFGKVVKDACDELGDELAPEGIFDLFKKEYLEFSGRYQIKRHKIYDESEVDGDSKTHFEGAIFDKKVNREYTLSTVGNGPIDAFFKALRIMGLSSYKFISYHEHAVSAGSDSYAAAYIELRNANGETIFGVGTHSNISFASIKGVLNAINRDTEKSST